MVGAVQVLQGQARRELEEVAHVQEQEQLRGCCAEQPVLSSGAPGTGVSKNGT